MVVTAGWPVTLVGLDVTLKVTLTEALLQQLDDSGTVAGRHLRRITRHYLDFYAGRSGRRECAMHDALALAIAGDPSLALRTPKASVDVELTGAHTRGMTVADLQGADFVGYDAPPVVVAAPGETIRVPVFVSHFSDLEPPPTLRWWVTGVNEAGQVDTMEPRERPVEWTRYGVTSQKPVALRIVWSAVVCVASCAATAPILSCSARAVASSTK